MTNFHNITPDKINTKQTVNKKWTIVKTVKLKKVFPRK